MLTPSERRGALALVLLLTLGTCWDLWCAARIDGRRAPGGETPRESASADTIATADPASQPRVGATASSLSDSGVASAAAPLASGTRGHTKLPPSRPIDLNTADAEALHQLPGIGPVLAARIVAYRRTNGAFGSVDELRAVRGIGPRLFERVRRYVRTIR